MTKTPAYRWGSGRGRACAFANEKRRRNNFKRGEAQFVCFSCFFLLVAKIIQKRSQYLRVRKGARVVLSVITCFLVCAVTPRQLFFFLRLVFFYPFFLTQFFFTLQNWSDARRRKEATKKKGAKWDKKINKNPHKHIKNEQLAVVETQWSEY